MSAPLGWGLAIVAGAVAWLQYGWQGLLLAASVIVFWLLLQFSRALRVMKIAGGRPVGRVDSAVMLKARLKRGMSLMQVITLTRSLGQRIGDGEDPECWRWADAGGDAVALELRRGRLDAWSLARADQAGTATGSGVAAGSPPADPAEDDAPPRSR